MRYTLLRDLLVKIIDNDEDCQRPAILRYFSPEMAIEPNYRCGFCRNCVEDLNFQVNRARPLEYSKDSADILARLDKVLLESHAFNWQELEKLVKDLKPYPKDAHSRARRTLGYSPRNLSALFIAKEFAESNTLEYDSSYFMKIASEDFDLTNAIKAYDTVRSEYKKDVFNLLTREISVFNCPQGENWLYQEAKNLNLSKRDIEHLGLRVIANQLQEINLSTYSNKLKELLEDF